jgi:hypothetical protein
MKACTVNDGIGMLTEFSTEAAQLKLARKSTLCFGTMSRLNHFSHSSFRIPLTLCYRLLAKIRE